MRTTLKKYISIISFQIGVNCIGIPVFYNHYFVNTYRMQVARTKYF